MSNEVKFQLGDVYQYIPGHNFDAYIQYIFKIDIIKKTYEVVIRNKTQLIVHIDYWSPRNNIQYIPYTDIFREP